jgi:hypothetical protein
MYSDQKQEHEKVKALFDRLVSAPKKTFPPSGGSLDAPNDKGVYLIESPEGKVLHVGQTPRARGGIRQRLKNHLQGASSFVDVYFNNDGSRLRGSHTFRCLVIEDWRLRALVEAYAVGHLCPLHIGRGELRSRVSESE